MLRKGIISLGFLLLLAACAAGGEPIDVTRPAQTAPIMTTLPTQSAPTATPFERLPIATNTPAPTALTAAVEETAVARATPPPQVRRRSYSDPKLGVTFEYDPDWRLSMRPEEEWRIFTLEKHGYELRLRVRLVPEEIPTCGGQLRESDFDHFWEDELAGTETWRAKAEMGFVNGFHHDEIAFIDVVWPTFYDEAQGQGVVGEFSCLLTIAGKLLGIEYKLPVSVATLEAGDYEGQYLGELDHIVASLELIEPTDYAPAAETLQLEERFAWIEDDTNLHRLAGSEEGYRGSFECNDGPYRWLDDSHLMLFPIVDYTTWYEDPEGGQVTQPVVLDVTTGAYWPTDHARTDVCQLAVFSPALGLVVESRDGRVLLRDLNGISVGEHTGGNPLHMGDSGLRLLAGDTWIDLTTGESVVLPVDEPRRLWKLAWTAEDIRLYACCAIYGDVQTGAFYQRDALDDIFPGGIGVGPGYNGEYVQWFANSQYVMHEPHAARWLRLDGADVASPDRPPVTPTLPLIDPSNETYLNLGVELGLTQTSDCIWGYHIRPLHDQVWLMNCTDEGLLVDIPALTAQPVTGCTFIEWSPGGRYALLTSGGHYSLLDPEALTFTQLPSVPASARPLAWSPQDEYLAVSDEGDGMLFLVETADGRGRVLPNLRTIGEVAWRPNSNVIAVVLDDGRIALAPFEQGDGIQVVAANAAVRDLRWSPEGSHLAWVMGKDVTILTAGG